MSTARRLLPALAALAALAWGAWIEYGQGASLLLVGALVWVDLSLDAHRRRAS